jgi:hypothetical protein
MDRQLTKMPLTLWKACANGDADRVVDLIREGVNVNGKNPYNGRAPLHEAAAHGQERVVRVLLSSKARVDEPSWAGKETPLHMASGNGHPAVVKVLLRRGRAKVDKANKYGCTALHVAVDELSVQYLLEYGAKAFAKCALGRTPLQYAIDRGNARAAQLIEGAVVHVVRKREARSLKRKKEIAERIEAQKQVEEEEQQRKLKEKMRIQYEQWRTPHVAKNVRKGVVDRKKLSVFAKRTPDFLKRYGR